MRELVLYSLIVLDPTPYAIETDLTNAQCQQAKNDYSVAMNASSKKAPRVILKCRPMVKRAVYR